MLHRIKGIKLENTKLKVKGILLDLDGTIVDSREAYLEAVKAAFTAIGQKTVNAKIATEIPRKLEQNLSINNIIKGADAQKFLDAYLNAYYKATAIKAKPIPSVSETLKKLSQKAKLALTTMRYVPKENVLNELENFGLAKYFQSVITALDTHFPKPSPEALMRCAEQLSVPISQCAVVGDSVADVRAGKTAGAKTVAVLSGIFTREELEREKPDLILKSINELPDFIE
ncbi:MAG: HAD family hydrolase [Candidatus Bathyarchaeota archaeon]|nr:HAD family hydrolase [Candidatus Bathyarchaeota archaeon]